MLSRRSHVVATALLAAVLTTFSAEAQGLRIDTGNDDPDEVAVAEMIRGLIDEYDLHAWLFTDHILVDRDTDIPHSHPVLTLNTDYRGDEVELLTNIIHENLHWFVLEDQAALGGSIRAMRARYPDAPDGPPTGARDLRSTYLHLVVCSLEFLALEDKLGRDAAAERLLSKPYYTWVFRTVVEDAADLRAILADNGFVLPGT